MALQSKGGCSVFLLFFFLMLFPPLWPVAWILFMGMQFNNLDRR